MSFTGALALLLRPVGTALDARVLASYVDAQSGERRSVTAAEYADHLLSTFGRTELPGYVHGLMLAAEARRLGIAVSDDAAAARADEEWRTFVDLRFAGDESAAARELLERGFTRDEYRAQLLMRARSTLLEEAIVLATRQVTEQDVVARFEHEYGAGGVRVDVRHVHLSRARVEQELIRAGQRPDQLTADAIDAELARRLAALEDELAAGADFADLARRASHDVGSANAGGVLAGYNYDRFGPEFAAAVRATEVGERFGPLVTAAGGHLGRVDARTVTRLEDVREALARALADEPPSPIERDALRRRLAEAADLRHE